jgi:nucleotide-binding universal stress UspA family protein
MSWKTILVPHDFSTSANHAAALARDEAKAHGARVVLLHVIELPSQLQPDAVMVPEATGAPINLRDYAVASAEAHLTDLAARLAKDGVAVSTFVRVGRPVEEITQLADDEHADLVVMGTHGRTGLQRMLIGSVTERVVRTAKMPVLTVRHPDHR